MPNKEYKVGDMVELVSIGTWDEIILNVKKGDTFEVVDTYDDEVVVNMSKHYPKDFKWAFWNAQVKPVKSTKGVGQ